MAPVALATHSIAPSAKGAFKKHEQPRERLGRVPLIDLYSSGPDSSSAEYKLRQEIVAGLKGSDKLTVPGEDSDAEDRRFAYKRTLPTTILYDEQGLVLYDKLTTAPEYYLYNAELEILREYGPEIALRIFGHPTPETAKVSAPNPQHAVPKKGLGRKQKWGDQDVGRFNGGVNAEEGLDGILAVGPASLVELGAGSLRKTVHLIRSLARLPAARRGPVVNYYALDLDRSELVRSLEDLRAQEADEGDENQWTVLGGKVALHGMWSTYDAGLEFIGNGGLDDKSVEGGPRCLMWLGSSIGSYDRGSAADFLAKAAARSLRPGDTMLVSIDRRNDPADVALAYDDPAGLTRDFIMNGISHADRVLGGGVLDPAKFEYCCRYNGREGRHEAYYRAREDQVIAIPGEAQPIHLAAGELIHVEFSYKYSEREALELFDSAGLRVVQKWTDSTQRYDTWLVERPQFHFSHGGKQALTGLPSLKEWGIMWEAWDTVTLSMIPTEMLHEKPIDLRHVCLFYLGHVPAFADIHISNYLDEPHTSNRFSTIFERGIDPHMDDVTQCNPHSEVPDRPEDWPALDEVLRYKDAVARRICKIYDDIAAGELVMDRRLARMLWMTLEHTAMHLETLLYMLNQSPNTLPPAGFTRPDWFTLARDWDTEHERRGGDLAYQQLVKFEAGKVVLGHDDDEGEDFDIKAARPSSNTDDLNRQLGQPEFGWDNEHPRRVVETDSFSISALPITNAQFAGFLSATGDVGQVPGSWVQLAEGEGYQVRTVYGPVDMRVAQHWPVQASGAQLAAYAGWKGGRLPTHAELRRFFDATAADRANVGFRNWHPVPASLPRRDTDGALLPGHNGGVWEWTSTAFTSYDGFRAAELYPGYSADFFDGKHNVVLGGSWATMPSIAGRRSFVNWYQTGYPFVFGGARVVHDAKTKVAAV